jgi:hypothetical protein
MLISVHVPKTGGISFMDLLRAGYGDRLLLDYEDRPMTHSAFARFTRSLRHWPANARRLHGYDCVHGHFLPLKYLWFRQASFAIWLRDPVEAAVSRYFFLKRYLKSDDPQFRKYIKRRDLSLEDFVQLPHFHNLYAKYLVGIRLSRFDFIGITERYGESVEVFQRMFLPHVEHRPTQKNTNPDKTGKTYDVSAELRREIASLNWKDQAIYERALGKNTELIARYLGTTPGAPA